MKNDKRWGKNFVDQRNWKVVNENLVVRGEFLLELDWVDSWNDELRNMNEGKRGSPFEFPESLIKLQAVWGQWVDYRGLEGITKKLQEHCLIPKYNDFSTIQRRVTKTEIDFELPKKRNVSASCDGSGIKMNNGGIYREKTYGRNTRRGFIKVVITADPIEKKLLDCNVCIPGWGKSEPEIALLHLKKLIKLGYDVNKFWGDSSFDTLDLFNFLSEHNIESAIKPRTINTSEEIESQARKKEVDKYKKLGYKKWAKKRRYGRRWTGTEGIFSAVKRKYGENIRALDTNNMLKEAKRKFWAYEKVRIYAKNKKRTIA